MCCAALSSVASFLHIPADDVVTLLICEVLRPSFCHCLLGCFSLLLAVKGVMDMLGQDVDISDVLKSSVCAVLPSCSASWGSVAALDKNGGCEVFSLHLGQTSRICSAACGFQSGFFAMLFWIKGRVHAVLQELPVGFLSILLIFLLIFLTFLRFGLSFHWWCLFFCIYVPEFSFPTPWWFECRLMCSLGGLLDDVGCLDSVEILIQVKGRQFVLQHWCPGLISLDSNRDL